MRSDDTSTASELPTEGSSAELDLNAFELCPNCQLSVLPEYIEEGKCPICRYYGPQ